MAYVPHRYTVFSTEAYTVVDGLPRATADTSRPPVAARVESGNSGYWMVYAYLPDGTKVDVTTVRGAPTQVSSVSTTDPFGPAAATLVFPAVTMLDAVGTGSLAWLAPENDVDIVWVNADPTFGTVGAARYTWEGYFTSYDYEASSSGSGLTVACRGAMFQMDNYLAKPEYPYRPLPYEVAIRQMFLDPQSGHTELRKDLRLNSPTLVSAAFPSGWTRTYNASSFAALGASWAVPTGVSNGDKWTGLLTRSTGNWEPCLTGYIQGLLTNMQFSLDDDSATPTGQFTLLLNAGRVPSLKFRPFLTSASQAPLSGESVLTVDVTWPGVEFQATKDYSQRASVVYSQGSASSGVVHSGMQVSYDGQITTYTPAAWNNNVYPQLDSNASLDLTVMRKEVKVDFEDGMTRAQTRTAANAYLKRFADPGVTGTLTLNTDPLTQAGRPYPRWIIQAGCTIQVKGLFGSSAGVLFHVTEATIGQDGAAVLTVDSKYRDQLTVDQVMLRGRDSLIPFRAISTAGNYAPKVPDLLYPWSYATGAGVIPEWRADPVANAAQKSIFARAVDELNANPAAHGFVDVAEQVEFPWTPYTTLYPPSSYPQYYIRVPARSTTNSDYNWAQRNYDPSLTRAQNLAAWTGGTGQTYRVKLAAKGTIRMIQFAAYNADGTVKQVPFHVSFYGYSGVTYQKMPMIPAGATLPSGVSYGNGQHYPFFAEAWEKINPNGTTPTDTQQLVAADGGSFLAGWGTFYERAGYSPGSSANGDSVTGRLQDEVGFSWDFTTDANRINPTLAYASQLGADVWAYVMVYCDASTTDTYFLGRLWAQAYE